MKLPLLLLALALPVLAQTPGTRVPADNLKGKSTAVPQVLVILPNGLFVQADLGSGLVIDTTGPRPVLRPTGLLSNRVIGETPVTATDPVVFTLANTPKAGTVAVYRNGLRQKLGLDYSIQDKTITFIPYYAGDPAPVIVVDYEW